MTTPATGRRDPDDAAVDVLMHPVTVKQGLDDVTAVFLVEDLKDAGLRVVWAD